MPIKRRQSKARNQKITDEAIELFRRVRDADTSDQWWDAHSALHRALQSKPWEWPCVEDPTAERNYESRPEAVALWIELEEVAR